VTLLVPQPEGIPTPAPSEVSRPYWEGCARGELLFQRCGDCGAATHTPAAICSACWSTSLAWEPSARRGVVYSWTVVWRPPVPSFVVPYAPAIVAMDEGWHLLTNVIGIDHTEVRVDQPVRIELHPVGGGASLPYARPL
jgi:uncharacterized OB-fold protein